MLISCDPTGFPLIGFPHSDIELQLLPVTRWQIDRWLVAKKTGPTDPSDKPDWYNESLEHNPSVSVEEFVPENRNGLFATGVLPEDALAFADWLKDQECNRGKKYTLPSVEEWRSFCFRFSLEAFTPENAQRLLRRSTEERHGLCNEAHTILRRLLDQLPPVTWLDLSLMVNGVVEWTRQNKSWVGLGSPQQHSHPNLWNPMVDAVRPIRPRERLPYFGFRLVRRFE